MAVGIDVIVISRVAKVLAKHPERFLRRVYTPEEVAFCRGRVPELAARFAAKEAVMKALGAEGIAFAFRDIEVMRTESGAPSIVLHGRVAERAKELGVGRIHVSLTHAEPLALASVMAERGRA